MSRSRVNLAEFGALGAVQQDATASFRDALAVLSEGGVLEINAGTYHLSEGMVISTPIQVIGAGRSATVITAGKHPITPLTLDCIRCGVKDLTLVGTEDLLTTAPALRLTGKAVESVLEDIWVLYGTGLYTSAVDLIMRGVIVDYSYGRALVEDDSAGAWYSRCKFDQNWPAGMQPSGLVREIPNWMSGNYDKGQIVRVGNFVLQCVQGGHSGQAAPVPAEYQIPIQDNEITWQLAAPFDYASLRLDGDGCEHQLAQLDFSGSFMNGLVVGGAALSIKLTQSVIGQQLCQGIALVGAGRNMIISDNEIAGGTFSQNSTAVTVGRNWVGPVLAHDNFLISAPSQMGFCVMGGNGSIIHDNSVRGFTYNDINIAPTAGCLAHDNY